jgi:chromosome segregation ATPase
LLVGLVIKPLDLLTFSKAHQRVMEHAFGRILIAADAEVAARLATCYGLASVTLNGRISRPGSLQGGWQGTPPRMQTAAAVLELSLVQVHKATTVSS